MSGHMEQRHRMTNGFASTYRANGRDAFPHPPMDQRLARFFNVDPLGTVLLDLLLVSDWLTKEQRF